MLKMSWSKNLNFPVTWWRGSYVLANIDLNNNVNDDDSNTDKNEDEELEVSLNTDSYGEVSQENDCDTFMKKCMTNQPLRQKRAV